MRTVHETEALRPSDPIPKSHPNHPQNIANTAYADALFRRQSKVTGANGEGFRVMQLTTTTSFPQVQNGYTSSSRLGNNANSNINNNTSISYASDSEMENGLTKPSTTSRLQAKTQKSYYPTSDPFSVEDESFRAPKELYKYLKQKLKWVQAEHDQLQKELDGYSKRRREAWVKKELLLERLIKMELAEDGGGVSIFWEKGGSNREGGGEGDAEMKEADEVGAESVARRRVVAEVRNGGARRRQADDEEEDDEPAEGEGEDEYATEEE